MSPRSAKAAGQRIAAAVLLLLFVAATAHASPLSDDLTARRARLASRLGPGVLLVLWSAPTRQYSLDVDYEYRQESNLYYLSGITQEETILLMLTGTEPREVLFVQPKDPSREHWYGRVLTTEEAAAQSGVREVTTIDRFQSVVDDMLTRKAATEIALLLPPPPPEVQAPAKSSEAVILPGPTREAEFAKRMREKFAGLKTIDATPSLTELRLVKTPYEQSLLVKGLQISSDAQMVGMRTARPGVFEYQVKAAIEGAYKARGAISWAYPSIVGSGPNATILHYPDGDRQMQAGDLLLVDAAGNYQYMAGDITRTYPVTGRFTQAQKDIYSIVLQAQDAGASMAYAGSSIAAVHNATVGVIKAGLLRLGLITDASGDQYKMWFTHGASHYIGIDVHDVGERTHPLERGMAFTIEPGLYIRQSALDALPKTAENAALIRAIEPAVNRYLDIGVRVEDSFLLDASGPRRLSGSVPRTIDEIETFMRKGK